MGHWARTPKVGDVVRIPDGAFQEQGRLSWARGYHGHHAIVVRMGWQKADVHPLVKGLKRDITVPLSLPRLRPVSLDDITDEEGAALMVWTMMR